MSTRTVVTFNDTDLTSLAIVSGWDVAALPKTIDRVTIPGMDGTRIVGSTIGAKEIKTTLTVKGPTPAARAASIRALLAVLDVDEPKPLARSIDDGLYYLAMPTGTASIKHARTSDSFDITFHAPSPALYGETKTGTINTTTSTLKVGGTYPTKPVINVTGAKGNSSNVFTIMDASGEYMQLTVSSSGSSTIEIDCEKHIAKVNNVTQMLSINSDWLELAPGNNRIRISSGSGTATATWIERWL